MKKLFTIAVVTCILAACNGSADTSSNHDSADSTGSVVRDGDKARTDTTGPRVDSGTAK